MQSSFNRILIGVRHCCNIFPSVITVNSVSKHFPFYLISRQYEILCTALEQYILELLIVIVVSDWSYNIIK